MICDTRIGLNIDGTYGGLTLPLNQSRIIWYVSWSSLPSFLYAFYKGYFDLSIVPLSVYISSINYWYYPVKYSWKRYLDMCCVLSGMTYQCIKARNYENVNYFYPILFIGIICFPLSTFVRHNYPHKHICNIWYSTLIHCMIHIFGNIANFVLYYGKMHK